MKWQTYERYLRMALAQQLEIPILGKLMFAVPDDSTTSKYQEWLRNDMDVPAELIKAGATAPKDAYNELTGYRNDVVLVAPGAYDIGAELDWTKQATHMLGMGGANQMGDYSEPNVVIYTDTAAVAQTIDLSGANCQFQNVSIHNWGNDAGNLAALKLDNYGCKFKNVGFAGTATAGNDDVVAAASLYIDGSGSYPIFENCVIGQNCWDVREGANSGVLRFTGTAGTGPYNGHFKNCRFLSRSETATVAMVALPADYCIHGDWFFEDCHFSNYSSNWQNNLNQVFYDNVASSHMIMLKRCTAIGIDEWQDADAGNSHIGADMPIVGTGGGLARNPTAGTGS